jgi:hypothetical protein
MMSDDPHTLLARALDGDADAGEALTTLAKAGSVESQRALLNGLHTMCERSEIDGDEYFERAMPWARVAAKSGQSFDIRRLSVLLDLKARAIRARGGSDLAFIPYESEAWQLLDELCDRGDEEALQIAAAAAPTASPFALQVARWVRSKAATVHPLQEPEALLPASLNDVGRWERVRWWLQDRWWDVRDVFGRFAWAVEGRWLDFRDWLDERRGR